MLFACGDGGGFGLRNGSDRIGSESELEMENPTPRSDSLNGHCSFMDFAEGRGCE